MSAVPKEKHAFQQWVRAVEKRARAPVPPVPSSPPGLGPGELLGGRYLIVSQLDAGGVGNVYRAEDTKLSRRVAVKVLKDEFVDHAALRPRFEREARALSALSHPHIISIIDYGVHRNRPYLVMELVEGETVHTLLEAGPMPVVVALEIAHQVLLALGYAHDQGLVHRDIKPGNILVQNVSQESFHVQILDFGFAKFLRGRDAAESVDLSEPGIAFGTPSYMAPEQLTDRATDARTDLYGVGVILFEMLTGHPPFDGDLREVVTQHLQSDVPHVELLRPDLADADAVDAVISKAMAKSPDDRFASAQEMIHAMQTIPEWSTPRMSAPSPGPSSRPPPSTMDLSSGDLEHMEVSDAAAEGTLELTSGELEPVSEDALPEEIPDAPPPIGPEPSVRIPTYGGRWPLVLLLLLVAGGAAAGGWYLWQRPGEPQIATSPPPVEEAEPDPELPPAPETAEVDPWSRPAVPLLDTVRAQQERGEPVSDAQVRMLMSLADRYRNDPRPHLLLARVNVERDQLRFAVERYRRAWRADPSARLDVHMREDLERLAQNERTATRAARLLERVYPEEVAAASD